jgi:serine/threonine protein kinase
MSYFAKKDHLNGFYHGTASYMTPKVVRCLSYDPLKADIYSLGKILDYMVGYSLFDVYVY